MASFPTLQRRGTETHNPVDMELSNELAHDPTIRSSSDGGYVTSRSKFTRLADNWTVKYTWLSNTNKNLIKTFERVTVVGGSDSFTWTSPGDDTAYTVRFLGKVKYTPHANTNALFWAVDFMLEEV